MKKFKKYLISYVNYRDKEQREVSVMNPVLINFDNGWFGIRTGFWITRYYFLNKDGNAVCRRPSEVRSRCLMDFDTAKKVLHNLETNHNMHSAVKEKQENDEYSALVAKNKRHSRLSYDVVGRVKDE